MNTVLTDGLRTFSSVVLLLMAPFGGCSVASPPRGQVGKNVPRVGNPMPAASSAVTVVHKGRLLCNHTVRAGGVKFSFDVVCSTSIVAYVQTSDLRFLPPEGIRIGAPLEEAIAVPLASLGPIDGVCGVSLPSGWIARPRSGLEPADESCNSLRSEPIAFFDTRYAGP